MAKSILPGNYVEPLSSYQNQCVKALPGRVYYHVVGYANVTTTGGTVFDVIIPSPDKRTDDKPRADITGLVLPAGAIVYHAALRVPDLRSDRGVGTATSSLSGTNTNRIKLADAIGNDNTLSATVVATNSAAVVVASGTVAPVATTIGVITPAALSGAETLKVYVTDSTGTAAGSTLSSTRSGGTPIIVEVGYYLNDVCADTDAVNLPYLTVS
jgi:hypothetical protein